MREHANQRWPKTPGPKGPPILGMALKIRRDPLNVLRNFAREYGDIVLFMS